MQEEDRGDEDSEPLQQMQKKQSGYSDRTDLSGNSKEVSQEEMINITSCDFNDFAAYMSRQYGAAEFKEGYKIVKSKQDLIYLDDGEE